MGYENLRKIAGNAVLVLGLAAATVLPAAAQANNNNANRNDRNDNGTPTRVIEQRDDDTDWGWLGLLGLLGLAGLIPKKRHVEVQQFKDVRTDQTGGTGPGTGAAR